MRFTHIVRLDSLLNLMAGEKFIQKKSIGDFEKSKDAEVFMRLLEPAYGFLSVSLLNGEFKFDADGEVAVVTQS